MKLSETLDKVIGLATTILEYWETELPKRHPDYPFARPGEEPPPPPPEEKKLAKLLASLPEDEVYKIRLVMDLGSGYFDIGKLASHYKTLKENFEVSELVTLLAGKVTLAEYLQDGLAELRKHNIGVDKLPLKPARTRK